MNPSRLERLEFDLRKEIEEHNRVLMKSMRQIVMKHTKQLIEGNQNETRNDERNDEETNSGVSNS